MIRIGDYGIDVSDRCYAVGKERKLREDEKALDGDV